MGAPMLKVAEPEMESINLVEPEPEIDRRHLLGIHIHAVARNGSGATSRCLAVGLVPGWRIRHSNRLLTATTR